MRIRKKQTSQPAEDRRTETPPARVFQPLGRTGRQHMEYIHFIGAFDDLPFEPFAVEMRAHYPHLLAAQEAERNNCAGPVATGRPAGRSK